MYMKTESGPQKVPEVPFLDAVFAAPAPQLPVEIKTDAPVDTKNGWRTGFFIATIIGIILALIILFLIIKKHF